MNKFLFIGGGNRPRFLQLISFLVLTLVLFSCGNEVDPTILPSYVPPYTPPTRPEGFKLTEEFFPDANLRTALATILKIKEGDLITDEIISKAQNFTLTNKNIQDLSGIEYFNNLQVLDIGKNPIKTVDLRNFPELISFIAESTELTEIDLRYNTKLQAFNVKGNKLTNLNLYQNKDLSGFDVSNNENLSLIIFPPTILCPTGDGWKIVLFLLDNTKISTATIDSLISKLETNKDPANTPILALDNYEKLTRATRAEAIKKGWNVPSAGSIGLDSKHFPDKKLLQKVIEYFTFKNSKTGEVYFSPKQGDLITPKQLETIVENIKNKTWQNIGLFPLVSLSIDESVDLTGIRYLYDILGIVSLGPSSDTSPKASYKGFEDIYELKDLSWLVVYNSKITKLPDLEFKGLDSLTILEIKNVEFENKNTIKISQPINSGITITGTNLSKVDFSEIPTSSSEPVVLSADLSNNQLKYISFPNAYKLNGFNVSRNKLTYLQLYNAKEVAGTIDVSCNELPEIKMNNGILKCSKLYLYGNKFTEDAFKSLKDYFDKTISASVYLSSDNYDNPNKPGYLYDYFEYNDDAHGYTNHLSTLTGNIKFYRYYNGEEEEYTP